MKIDVTRIRLSISDYTFKQRVLALGCSRGFSTSGTSDNGQQEKPKAKKLWGGRFSKDTDPLMEKFNSSFHIDKRMWKEDIIGSIAYSKALQRCGIITEHESKEIQRGMKLILEEWADSKFVSKSSDEDIHTANERRLHELINPEIAGKLHTGRSRNDQVITDFRLWMKTSVIDLIHDTDQVISSIVKRFESNKEMDVIMCGYTHLQQAQCVRWSHYLLSYAFMFKRDAEKLKDSMKYIDVLPLGSGAIAGHSFFSPTCRKHLAKDLGFAYVSDNSMDAISDRDFVLDFLYHCSLISTHLSRLSEDLIIFNTQEFGYVKMSDAYSTGSSLMPQKKNPDACEIIRGKSGEVIGNLLSFMIILKGLPVTYNKDLQDDKKLVFETHDTIRDCLQIMAKIIETMKVNEKHLQESFDNKKNDFLYATDLADYLVRKMVPFRKTHHIAGEAVQLSETTGKPLSELTVEQLKSLHSFFEEDVKGIFNPRHSVEKKNAEGSTSERAVKEQIKKLSDYLNRNK